MKIRLIMGLALAAAAAQGIEFKGVTNLQQPQPVNLNCWQGETLTIMPALESHQARVIPVEASFHWQTNGMDSLYWPKAADILEDGRIVAVFHPTNDCGAASYDYFIRSTLPDGSISYRTHGTITMLPSPGFVPNALPMPVYEIDFNAINWINAPWLLPAALDGFATEDWVADYVANNAPDIPALEEADPIALPVASAALAGLTNKLSVADLLSNEKISWTNVMSDDLVTMGRGLKIGTSGGNVFDISSRRAGYTGSSGLITSAKFYSYLDPTDNRHLTPKIYVDTALAGKASVADVTNAMDKATNALDKANAAYTLGNNATATANIADQTARDALAMAQGKTSAQDVQDIVMGKGFIANGDRSAQLTEQVWVGAMDYPYAALNGEGSIVMEAADWADPMGAWWRTWYTPGGIVADRMLESEGWEEKTTYYRLPSPAESAVTLATEEHVRVETGNALLAAMDYTDVAIGNLPMPALWDTLIDVTITPSPGGPNVQSPAFTWEAGWKYMIALIPISGTTGSSNTADNNICISGLDTSGTVARNYSNATQVRTATLGIYGVVNCLASWNSEVMLTSDSNYVCFTLRYGLVTSGAVNIPVANATATLSVTTLTGTPAVPPTERVIVYMTSPSAIQQKVTYRYLVRRQAIF